MKKFTFLSAIFLIILMGAGCISNKDITPSINDEQPITTGTTPDKSEATPKTLAERMLLGITVKNAITKKIVPGAIVAIPYTTYAHTTDQNGYVEISQKYETIYIAKMSSYQATDKINLEPYKSTEVLEVFLQPEAPTNGYELVYLDGSTLPNAYGTTTIEGQIKRNGKALANLPIAVAQTNIKAKTNTEGKFTIQTTIKNGGLRLYFPTLNLKKYFQVDAVKDTTINITIDL